MKKQLPDIEVSRDCRGRYYVLVDDKPVRNSCGYIMKFSSLQDPELMGLVIRLAGTTHYNGSFQIH